MPRFRPVALLMSALAAASCGSGSTTPATTPVASSPPAATVAAATPSPAGGLQPVAMPVAGSPPRTGRPWMLALGDSITSGYTADPARAGVNSGWPVHLQKLLAATGRSWDLYDLACPGETTITYNTRCPYATLVAPLGTRSQRQVADEAIAVHRADLRLILIDLGSNDLLAASRGQQDPASAIAATTGRLDAIVSELHQAAPGVALVVANYYDPLANRLPSTVGAVGIANAQVAAIAARYGAGLADFFSAINTAPAPDPQLCVYIDCVRLDIHPTIAGHARLAARALAAILP